MAGPTEAEAQNQLQLAVDILKETRLFAETNAENFIALEDALIQVLEGDYSAQIAGAVGAVRAGLSGMMARGSAAALLYPIALHLGQIYNIPETDQATLAARLWRAFHDGSETVASRNITFATPAAGGGNTGNGSLHRLTVDELNYDIEACHMEAKTAEVVADANSGANEHQEIWQVKGVESSKDWVGYSGSGLVGTIRCISAEQSLLVNPSFSTYDSTGGLTTKFDGWTITTAAANVTQDTADYYREAGPGDTTPAAIDFVDNDKIVQKLSVRRTALNRNTPYYLQIAWQRESSADGTLTLRCGSNSASVAVNTGTNDAWNVLKLALNQNLWPANFNEDPCDIEIELASRTTGNVLVDDVIFAPFTPFDGTWWFAVGGATPFLLQDTFTMTDALAGSDSIIQYWWWRAFGTYLPHTTATPTIADP